MERKATAAEMAEEVFSVIRKEFVGFSKKEEDGTIFFTLVNGQRFKISITEE